jgi:hypothetical protein
MAQVIDHLPAKRKVLSSNSGTTRKKRKRKGKQKNSFTEKLLQRIHRASSHTPCPSFLRFDQSCISLSPRLVVFPG